MMIDEVAPIGLWLFKWNTVFPTKRYDGFLTSPIVSPGNWPFSNKKKSLSAYPFFQNLKQKIFTRGKIRRKWPVREQVATQFPILHQENMHVCTFTMSWRECTLFFASFGPFFYELSSKFGDSAYDDSFKLVAHGCSVGN